MLYAFGFDRVGVVVGDLYIVDPDPIPGQEGPEQGARLEVRRFERPPLEGGIYSAQPILVGPPVWRADLLEAVDHPGTLDRAHHHPRFAGWDPCERVFEAELSADPLAWVGRRLAAFEGLDEADSVALRAAVPEILDAVRRVLDHVRAAGDHGREADPEGDRGAGVRVSWL